VPVNFNVTTSGLFGIFRNLASYAAIITAVANVGGMPASVRGVLLAIGGAIQYAEHTNNTATTVTTKPPVGPTP
jgi:hypothetical protein